MCEHEGRPPERSRRKTPQRRKMAGPIKDRFEDRTSRRPGYSPLAQILGNPLPTRLEDVERRSLSPGGTPPLAVGHGYNPAFGEVGRPIGAGTGHAGKLACAA